MGKKWVKPIFYNKNITQRVKKCNKKEPEISDSFKPFGLAKTRCIEEYPAPFFNF
jgi:hypothetical protein